MTIREYTPADKTQLMSLTSEFCAYLESIDPMGRTQFMKNNEEYFVDRFVNEAQKKRGKVFVAEEDGTVIGFTSGYIEEQSKEELKEEKKATPGVINELFITTEKRKSGVGTQLLEGIENHLKQQGCTFVRLEVFGPNEMAREFYKKHGYQERAIIVSKDF